MAAGHKINGM